MSNAEWIKYLVQILDNESRKQLADHLASVNSSERVDDMRELIFKSICELLGKSQEHHASGIFSLRIRLESGIVTEINSDWEELDLTKEMNDVKSLVEAYRSSGSPIPNSEANA